MSILQFTFANPSFLWLLLAIVPFVVWYVLRNNRTQASIQISGLQSIASAPRTWRHYFRHSMFVLRMLAFALLVLALARPQSTDSWQNSTRYGIDIMIALDVSTSMLAEDLKPNRLEAAKEVGSEFVVGRPADRIGLVLFAGESFTQCPLTTDHVVLLNLFKDVKSGVLEDGTAIGMGLANAVTRLRTSDSKSKVIVLLTDGENNRGDIDPLTASEIALAYGVRVYTVGVGTIGMAPYPFPTAFGTQYQNVEVKIDEKLLKDIAHNTGGKYFRATSTTKLREIYKEIDKLEKAKIEVTEYSKKHEEFFIFALIAAVFLVLEIVLRYSVFRAIP